MEDFGKAKQDWFATFLPLPNGIPSDDTFTRVFSILDPTSFQDCFMRWTQSLREAIDREIVAIDGKALRHAREAGGDVRSIVNAWAGANRLILGQLKVPDKKPTRSPPSPPSCAPLNSRDASSPPTSSAASRRSPARSSKRTPTTSWRSKAITNPSTKKWCLSSMMKSPVTPRQRRRE
jgi:hypothetical protein